MTDQWENEGGSVPADLGAQLIVKMYHRWADEQNDMQDHDEYHAAAVVIGMLNGIEPDERGIEYITRWTTNLLKREMDK